MMCLDFSIYTYDDPLLRLDDVAALLRGDPARLEEFEEGLLGPHVAGRELLRPLADHVLLLDGVVAKVDRLVEAAQRVLLRGKPERSRFV